jgi:hypothetical protein
MSRATGSFRVLGGGEDPIDELEAGIRLTHANGTQRFSGDLEADGLVHWLMVYRDDRTARFVGLQRLRGTIGGRTGAFVLTAEGDHDGTSSRIELTVVPGSGTGELAGIAGAGRLVAPSGPVGNYELEYELPI